jgi:hypothetical protein
VKTNKIIFKAQNEHVWEVREKPYPASKKLPEWWKKISPYSTLDNKLRLNPGPTVTVKKCLPTLDALGAGYIVPLWTDLLVSQNNNMPHIQWPTSEPVLQNWPKDQVSSYEIPENFSSIIFKYLHGWIIKTPPGWSSFITHPIGYQNLPFKSISGIVDTDTFPLEINFPIVINGDKYPQLDTLIKKGTPYVQVIPFKRDNWKLKLSSKKQIDILKERIKYDLTIYQKYKRKFWEKKSCI